VQGLACLLVPFGDDAMRTILAVIGGEQCDHDQAGSTLCGPSLGRREPGARP
jgi:hypothetical protein